MYKIIGADKNEYGPVTIEQLRQWISEGRVNAQTLAKPEGGTEWKPISQYPDFVHLFAAPAAATAVEYATADARAAALERVSGPATGLIATAIFGFIASIAGLVMNLTGTTFGGGDVETPQWVEMLSGTLGIVSAAIGVALSALILVAGSKMKKLESYGLCMGASIIAMVPCISPCCLIGLPVGIWALVVLTKPEVKSQFH